MNAYRGSSEYGISRIAGSEYLSLCAETPGMLWIKSLVAVSALAAMLPVASAQQRTAINLNTYSQVEIDRPPAAVWPYILDPNQWKPERHLIHHAGPEGKVGEVFAVVGSANPGKIWFLAE